VANLPTVSTPLPRDLQGFVQRVREVIDGNGLDAVVTERKLISRGLTATSVGGVAVVGETIDTPRAPRNVTTSGALANIIVSWDGPNYGGHSYSEIWAHTADLIGEAVLVGMTAGDNFSHNIGAAAVRYYWVRNINRNGVASAFNATAGTQGSTGQDPAYLLSLLTDEITTSQLAGALNTRIDLVDAAASVTGSVNARIQTVSSTVGTNTAAIQTNSTAVNGLEAQYTVKIDNNGAVAGFGLASTTTGSGNITSEFIVNADRFAIMRGGSDTTAAVVPFVVQATPTTINNETVPAGVYMETAFIKNGTINSAKIGSLTADKISASLLNTVDFYGNTIAGSEIYLGGTVNYTQDGGGNNIGISNVSSPKVSMTSTGAVFAVDAFTIDNPGGSSVTPFAVVNNTVRIDAAVIGDASITTAKIGNAEITTAKIEDAAITTAKIGNAEVTTAKIEDAAITTAKIGNASITDAKIGNAEITTAKIDDAAITTAKIDNAAITTAKIGNAAIGTAQIGDLQVSTLKIAGQAVSNTAFDEDTKSGQWSGFETVADLTLSTEGGNKVIVQMSCNATIGSSGQGQPVVLTMQLLRNNVLVETYGRLFDDQTYGNSIGPSAVYVDTSASGTTNYKTKLNRQGDGTVSFTSYLVATELKR